MSLLSTKTETNKTKLYKCFFFYFFVGVRGCCITWLCSYIMAKTSLFFMRWWYLFVIDQHTQLLVIWILNGVYNKETTNTNCILWFYPSGDQSTIYCTDGLYFWGRGGNLIYDVISVCLILKYICMYYFSIHFHISFYIDMT